jgi:hypothetical protein
MSLGDSCAASVSALRLPSTKKDEVRWHMSELQAEDQAASQKPCSLFNCCATYNNGRFDSRFLFTWTKVEP